MECWTKRVEKQEDLKNNKNVNLYWCSNKFYKYIRDNY